MRLEVVSQSPLPEPRLAWYRHPAFWMGASLAFAIGSFAALLAGVTHPEWFAADPWSALPMTGVLLAVMCGIPAVALGIAARDHAATGLGWVSLIFSFLLILAIGYATQLPSVAITREAAAVAIPSDWPLLADENPETAFALDAYPRILRVYEVPGTFDEARQALARAFTAGNGWLALANLEGSGVWGVGRGDISLTLSEELPGLADQLDSVYLELTAAHLSHPPTA